MELKSLGTKRYVGDRVKKVVHDRWHPDSEGCGLSGLVQSGDAEGFEPDTLDTALWAGYEYCEACFDRTEPAPPNSSPPESGFGSRGGRDGPPSASPPVAGERSGRESRLQIRLVEVRG